MDRHFIQVVLPLKLQWIPFYYCEEPVRRGQIVSVVFAGRRYNGIVYNTSCTPDLNPASVKQISSVRKDLPTIGGMELRLWEFIADYYACTIGEVFKAAYPAGKLNGEIAAAAREERLRKRLDAIDADLTKRHRESVMLRLRQERDRIAASLPASDPIRNTGPKNDDALTYKPILVTGPDRYDYYRTVLQECSDSGRQALLLSPETALCEQVANMTGIRTVVHHGKTDAFITGVSAALRRGEPISVAGTRMSIFLPFSSLGAIIVDEEQDQSFKQTEPSPRYNARDCAVFLGTIHHCQVILGSSRPSLESIYNCKTGKYNIKGELSSRFSPHTEFIDIQAEKKKNGMPGYLSRKLLERISHSKGRICLVRGWEKQEELSSQIRQFLPDREVNVLTLSELKRNGNGDACLTAVIQIDALADKDDFRYDERMQQIVAMLESTCCRNGGNLVIQTALVDIFSEDRDYETMLKERREFGFPPFTRMVDIRTADGKLASRHFIRRDQPLSEAKVSIKASLPPFCYMDVDPQ